MGVSPSMRDSRDLPSRLLETWQARLLSRLNDLWMKQSLKSNRVPSSKAALPGSRVGLELGSGMIKVYQTKVNLNKHLDTNTLALLEHFKQLYVHNYL